ncbi:hypothetical protein CDL12_22836 [Handroanthus impetiginosus]|uniref:Uncharacterized protein n=1 Tax=Handroanthus impetiginosus TaxID=429701 RepID=A0A2G9GH58_9LAMI|nr:hypothetical protein CDL12_22836 [Handroanthus impetiginosus]
MIEERGGGVEKMEAHQQLIKILEALNRVSHDLHEPLDSDSSAIKALLELRTASGSSLSSNPLPFSLSQHLSQLADSVQDLHNAKTSRHGLISFLTRRVKSHEVSRLAAEIESEIQALIDREAVSNLTKTLAEMRFSPSFDEDKLFNEMSVLQKTLSRGFDINLQDILLRSGIFANLEWVLCNPVFPKRVREKAAITMKDLVLFNKDVFVGSVLLGGSIKALVSTDSLCYLQVLSSLIKAIKSPFVDEMESCGGISNIVSYLSSNELEIKLMAMECVMEIGYFGRKEAVEAMINGDLIKRLVDLQRSEGDHIYGRCREMKKKNNPFERCVARFAVQVEVGEGLRQREKRDFKVQILNKVRETCVSDAESATTVAEVLWGSSP